MSNIAYSKLRIGTRASNLATIQANMVKRSIIDLLHYPEELIEIVPIKTTGDKILDRRLSDIGIRGVFTKELEEALINDDIDLAVHSLKDMPAYIDERLEISAVLEREDPRDALIGFNGPIENMPKNSTIATSSLRREAQIRAIRKDVNIVDIRGNIETRMKKLESNNIDATILAVAGLKRTGINESKYFKIDIDTIIPAPAQGIIAIESKKENTAIKEMLLAINHDATMLIAETERQFLRSWEDTKYEITKIKYDSCRVPLAAHAYIDNNQVHINSMVTYEDFSDIFYYKEIGNLSDSLDIAANLGYKLAKRAYTK